MECIWGSKAHPAGRSQSSINIEKHNGVLNGTIIQRGVESGGRGRGCFAESHDALGIRLSVVSLWGKEYLEKLRVMKLIKERGVSMRRRGWRGEIDLVGRDKLRSRS